MSRVVLLECASGENSNRAQDGIRLKRAGGNHFGSDYRGPKTIRGLIFPQHVGDEQDEQRGWSAGSIVFIRTIIGQPG